MTRVAIVIPYFQRTEGLLGAALEGVLAQTALPRVGEIVVVDDGSPVPARRETEALCARHPALAERLKLIEQVNGGVSRARNRGLDACSKDFEYVAFLDPDDVWAPDHLERALAALELGHDFYFANHFHIGKDEDAFGASGVLDTSAHAPLPIADIWRYEGNFAAQVALNNPVMTSGVVYRFRAHPDIRFDPRFRYAGEDYVMWMNLCRDRATRVCFSTRVGHRAGEGINLYSGAKWGTLHLSHRLLDEMDWQLEAWRAFDLPEAAKAPMREKILDRRRVFWQNIRGMLKRGRLSGMAKTVALLARRKRLWSLVFLGRLNQSVGRP